MEPIIKQIKDWSDITRLTKNPFLCPYEVTDTIEEKAINALAGWFRIAEAYNQGWKPNWKDPKELKYYVYKYWSDGRWVVGCDFFHGSSVLGASGAYFKSKECALDAAAKFENVLNEMLMIGDE